MNSSTGAEMAAIAPLHDFSI